MPEIQTIITALLQQRTPISFEASGPSMNPTICDGDSIFVRPLVDGHILCGNAILYKICGRIIVHRCIINRIRTNRVFTVGDAAVKGGDWIPISDVLGVAERVCRKEKYHRLDTRFARWAGLVRFYMRPLRRILIDLHCRFKGHSP